MARARLARWWFRRRLSAALALRRRREGRSDGLKLGRFETTLQVEWCARRVHPWDEGLREQEAGRRFVKQCLDDTSIAIEQLFRRLPEIEAIDFKVFDPDSSAPILCGVVRREEAEKVGRLSPGMKLKTLGATYRVSNTSFEPLN